MSLIAQSSVQVVDRPSEMTYWTIVITRNGERMVRSTLESVLTQTLRPRLVYVVDDGSTDETPEILKDFLARFAGEVAVTHLPDRGYDISRVVVNINTGLINGERLRVQARYVMLSGDDCVYPPNYAEYLIGKMDADPTIAVASGDIAGCGHPDITPRGSGRFVRTSFLRQIGGCFPVSYGYEAWILQKALQLDYRVRNFPEMRFEHSRCLGVDHGFRDWGLSMRCLGYHPLEVLSRCLRYVLLDRRLPLGYLVVLWDFTMSPLTRRNDSYFRYYNPGLRRFIWKRQAITACQRLSRFLSFQWANGAQTAR